MDVITGKRVLQKDNASIPGGIWENRPLWLVKLTNWEFWPFNVFYFPVFCYAAWLMIKSRSFFFFSAANPGIENGGMLGESKKTILDVIPEKYRPVTVLAQPGIKPEAFKKLVDENKIKYPFILKPDIGERGWMVKKIQNETQLYRYLKQIRAPFLLQEYVDLPLEMGIFYYRMPDEEKGRITSIALKEMLTVTGDGHSTIEELLAKKARSRIAFNEIRKTSGDIFGYVPKAGENVEVVPVGNHCRGTTFLDGNYLINEKVNRAIDAVAQTYPGFYYGRFDIRCSSVEKLESGEFKIMELNGSGAEPGHIYQPGFSITEAYRVLISHLDIMYRISKINRRKGVPYMTTAEGLRLIRFLRKLKKLRN